MTLNYDTDDTVNTVRGDTKLHSYIGMKWIKKSKSTRIYETAPCNMSAMTRKL